MKKHLSIIALAVAGMALLMNINTPQAHAEQPWVVYQGKQGPGQGKHIVLVSGDQEYRSEEALPQLGKILATRHGFKCTVLFAIDPKTGDIDPDNVNNLPGLEALKTADLMILGLRFRDLKDDQMQHFVDYLDSGRPIIALRTSTHAFNIKNGKKFSRYSFQSKEWAGGFGQQILGDTWLSHHGHHGKQSTRGVVAKAATGNPLVNGCEDIWGPTDVYGVRLPLPKSCQAIIMGQVLEGMKPSDKAVDTPKNKPMMPVAWTNSYKGTSGNVGRVFTTTMGSSTDLECEGLRRLLVNASYWCVGLETKIPDRADVALVGKYETLPFRFGGYKRGVKPADHELQ